MSDISALFSACDLDGSGTIDKEELASICPDLSSAEVDNIFKELDKDGDGSISIAEFSSGFQDLSDALMGISSTKDTTPEAPAENNNDPRAKDEEYSTDNISDLSQNLSQNLMTDLSDMGVPVTEDLITTLSCQEQVCELYQNLHHAASPELLSQFEDIILSVIKDIRTQQGECEQLESSFKKEKEQHSKHMSEMEEELENQVKKAEAKARREEHERLEAEKVDLKNQLEREIQDLKINMKKVQQLEDLQKQGKPDEEVKAKLEEMDIENKYLKNNLTDSHTRLAMLRSELASTKHVMEEKCIELESEKNQLYGFVKEQDSLSRQVHVLQESNKKLHDTNDDLLQALDNSRNTYRRTLEDELEEESKEEPGDESKATSTPLNRGEYVKQYLNSPHSGPLGASSLADELSMIEAPKRSLLPIQDSCELDSLPEDFDSGHSTMRGNDADSDGEPYEDQYYRKRHRIQRGLSGFDSLAESDLPESIGGFDTEIDMGDDDESIRSPSSSRASVRSSGSRRHGSLRRLPILPVNNATQPKVITKEPERMFKVVLAGDAAVGKSSFILRLCKDKFVSNLNSTLGVDFQTKTIEVEGHVIALQLWDTAGQERFRSVAKSYFRRADGVLLVYDCTYERSFLSVREWVETVQDSSSKTLPIMFVANKTDLRHEFENDGRNAIRCVQKEEGERLAREYDGLFIEASAKKGDHILDAVVNLTRLMQANQDMEVQNVGMTLQEANKQDKSKLIECCTL